VYSCDFFVEQKWRLGNIMHDRIINMLNSKTQQTFGVAKAVLPRECCQCSWLRNCYDGCTKDRIKDPSDHHKPRFCTTNKMFFKHADPALKQLAEQWKERQTIHQVKQQTGGVYNAIDDFMKK
ncbi:MAG TPA: SPASM domain-containing protein, partial [Prolixibacteraceae bacterium]